MTVLVLVTLMTAVKSGQYACVECPSSLSRVWIGTGTRVLNGGGGNCAPVYELLTWGRVGHLGDSRLPEVNVECVCAHSFLYLIIRFSKGSLL